MIQDSDRKTQHDSRALLFQKLSSFQVRKYFIISFTRPFVVYKLELFAKFELMVRACSTFGMPLDLFNLGVNNHQNVTCQQSTILFINEEKFLHISPMFTYLMRRSAMTTLLRLLSCSAGLHSRYSTEIELLTSRKSAPAIGILEVY